MAARNSMNIYQLEQFLSQYPDGEYSEDAQANINQLRDDEAFVSAMLEGTVESLERYLSSFYDGFHKYEAQQAIDSIKSTPAYIAEQERLRWIDNSLNSGSTPYSAYYGGNASCDSWGWSAIKVTAPPNSDVVVTIKRDNSSKYPIRHAYIRAGRTYNFEVPDGDYIVFFYYGQGWNPDKEMPGGVKGGFVSNEDFSKTGVEHLENQVLSLVLQSVLNGNFHPIDCDEEEMF